jgi:GPH family glycoside/pentoside/hexuronide:cation symporter
MRAATRNKTNPVNPAEHSHRLSVPTMIAYGIGQLGESLRTVGYTTFLLFYYNQVIGLSGTLTSLALGVSLIVDAVSDPLVGAWSDRTSSRWGRRHPFMLASMLPLGLLFYATFNPPQLEPGGYFVWLLMSATLTRLAVSLYHVPHLALGAEITRDYSQRSTLYSINTVFLFLAMYGTQGLALRFFFPTTERFNPGLLDPNAYVTFSIAFAVTMVVAIAISIVGTAREIPFLPPAVRRFNFSLRRTIADFIEVFRNASFRALFFGMLLTMLTLAVESVLKPYMDLHFWGLTTEQMSWRPLGIIAGALLALPFAPWLNRVFDKKVVLIAAGAVWVTAIHVLIATKYVAPDWLPANGTTALLQVLLVQDLIMGLSSVLTYGAVYSMIADISDEHQLEVGERREGVLFASRAFAQQVVQSIGIAGAGLLLDVIDFPTGAKAGTVDDPTLMRLGAIPLCAALVYLCGLCCYARYRIHRQQHARILSELAQRRLQETSHPA